MPPRVTAANVVATTQQLAQDFARVTREAGPMAATATLTQAAEEVSSLAQSPRLDVEVLLGSALTTADATALAAALAENFPPDALRTVSARAAIVDASDPAGQLAVRGHVRALSSASAPHRAGQPRPSVLVVAPGGASVGPEEMEHLERLATERPLVVLAGNSPEAVAPIVTRLNRRSWLLEGVNLTAPAGPSLATRFATPPWSAALPAFTAESAGVALDELSQVLRLAIESELRDLKVKRGIAQQRAQRPAGARPGATPAESLGEIKGRLQRQFAEFERGAAERLQDLLAFPSGSLAEEIEHRLVALSDLQTEARQNALSARVPEAFEAELNQLVRERLARHFVTDASILNDFLRMAAHDVERLVAQASGTETVVQLEHLTEERVRRVMGMAGAIQSPYRTELPSTGIAEYISAVRRGPMMFFMMMALVFGSAFMSQVRRAMEIYVPLVLVLIAGTLYGYHFSAQKQVAEAMAKGLEDARQSLRSELKKLLSDVQKQWSNVLSGHLSEQLAAALAQVESLLKDQGRRTADAGLDKERLQRQLALLDQAEKKLLAADKAREVLAASVTQMRAELKPIVAEALKPPAAPATAAAPQAPQAVAAAPAAAAPPVLPERPALAPRERPVLPPRERPTLPPREKPVLPKRPS